MATTARLLVLVPLAALVALVEAPEYRSTPADAQPQLVLGAPVQHLVPLEAPCGHEPMVVRHPLGSLFVTGGGLGKTPCLFRSNDGGATWTSMNAGAAPEGAVGPGDVDLAIAPDGTLYLIGAAYDNAKREGISITVGATSDDGATWSWTQLSRTRYDDRPWVEVAPDGTAHAIWNDGSGVLHAISRDRGRTWREQPRIHPQGGSSHLAVGPAGEVAVRIIPLSSPHASGLFTHEGADLVAVSTDGGATWTKHPAPGRRTWTMSSDEWERLPHWVEPLAWDASGALYYLWSHLDGLWVARSRDRGASWTTWRLGDNRETRYFPYIVARGEGELAATWFTGRGPDIKVHVARIDLPSGEGTPRMIEASFAPDTWRLFEQPKPGAPRNRDTCGEYVPITFLPDGRVAVVTAIQDTLESRAGFAWRTAETRKATGGASSLKAQPAAWQVVTLDGSNKAAYTVEATGGVTDAAGVVVTLRCVNPPCGGPAVAAVTLPAALFAGRLATVSGEVQTAGVKVGATIGLNAQRDGRDLLIKIGDMLRGDSPWTRQTASMAVPNETTSLLVGVVLQPGGGEITVRSLRIEAAERRAGVDAIEPAAQALLDSAFSIVKTHALRADSVDWFTVEPEVRSFAMGAREPADVHAAIEYLLSKLGDGHSFFAPPAATSKLKSGGVENPDIDVRAVADGIGYIGVPGYMGTAHAAAREFATRTLEALAAVRKDATCGWVVDLRENNGGNMWPMLAALRPLLGDGVLGSWVDRNGKSTKWSAKSEVDVAPPASLNGLQSAWVAVLTGPRTASSGEFVAIAFRGRPRTRSFGLPTAGLSTSNTDFQLADGSTIFLTTAVGVDRTETRYGGKLQPDETIDTSKSSAAEDATLSAAVRWLKQSSGCGKRD